MDCVVIDNGSSSIKAGFSGEDDPVAIIPTAVSTERIEPSVGLGSTTLDDSSRRRKGKQQEEMLRYIVGAKALKRGDFKSPIRRGRIQDWDSMEAIWDHVYERELNVEPESMPVLMTDTPLASKADREKMAQIMFENYNVPGFSVMSKSTLSLFATGRTRGLVVGVGAEVSSAVPVFEGYALPHATKRLDFAGEDLTDFLSTKLDRSFPRSLVQEIKESCCSVKSSQFRPMSASSASSQDEDTKRQSIKTYELPDGQIVDLDANCQHLVPEALFNPSIVSSTPSSNSLVGLSKLAHQCVLECDKTLQVDLLDSIVIAGGSSMLTGFAARLEQDMLKLTKRTHKVQVIPDSQRKYAAWIGGSMFGSLETFPQIVVSRTDWEENGTRIIHQKCF